MSLQNILDQICASGDAQIQEIERHAQIRVNEILAQARMEAEQIEEDSCADVSAPSNAERARIIHRAKLEALRIVGDARENLVNSAIEQTRTILSSLRSDPSYPIILQTLVEEALAQIRLSEQDGHPCLLADPRDQSLMNQILKTRQPQISIRYELNCWGGVTAQSADERVVVINTLEARLEQAIPFLRHHLAAYFRKTESTRISRSEQCPVTNTAMHACAP